MKTKKITILAMGIALYVVLASMLKAPLIGHIQTDLGYIAFGAWCVLFGWQAAIVGVIGCTIESLLFSGWLPIGWMLGQAVIGISCGLAYKHFNNIIIKIVITIISVFVGIAIIKTGVECWLYHIPIMVKFIKNTIAFVADVIPMITGLLIGNILKKKVE